VGSGQGSGLTLRALAAVGGAETVALATANMPAHSHGGQTGNDSPDHVHAGTTAAGLLPQQGPYSDGALAGVAQVGGNAYTGNIGFGQASHAHSFSTGGAGTIGSAGATAQRHQHSITSEGSGTGHANMQPFAVVAYIVKT